MKFFNICILLSFLSVGIEAQELKPKFLSKDAYKIISLAKDLYITKIQAMAFSPQFVPPGIVHPMAKPISAPDREVISKDLSLSYKINPDERLKECKLEPGLMLTYANGRNELGTVLICFNCDLWAISATNPNGYEDFKKTEVSAFGDLRPYRSDLIALAKKLFPQDESFKNLK